MGSHSRRRALRTSVLKLCVHTLLCQAVLGLSHKECERQDTLSTGLEAATEHLETDCTPLNLNYKRQNLNMNVLLILLWNVYNALSLRERDLHSPLLRLGSNGNLTCNSEIEKSHSRNDGSHQTVYSLNSVSPLPSRVHFARMETTVGSSFKC